MAQLPIHSKQLAAQLIKANFISHNINGTNKYQQKKWATKFKISQIVSQQVQRTKLLY